MRQLRKANWSGLILTLLILAGIFFRFYNLGWDEGLFFHPDENNIARAIAQLKPPDFHPHFFAYGQLPIYLVYTLWQIIHWFQGKVLFTPVSFAEAISGLRFFSALEGALAIYLSFWLGKRLLGIKGGLTAAALVSLTPGLIQAAHFGTTENLLTLVLLTTLALCLKIASQGSLKNWFGLAVLLGIGLATKVNALVFFGLPVISLVISRQVSLKNFLKLLGCFLSAGLMAFLFSPYQILALTDFRSTIEYETKIARGQIPVFYTRQFEQTLPLIFQFRRIFPFALGPTLLIFGLLGFGLVLKVALRERRPKETLLVSAFLLWLMPQSFLFVKWTRFLIPALPFFSLFSLIFLNRFSKRSGVSNSLTVSLLLGTALVALAFFYIYLKPDVRITALDWLNQNLKPQAQVLSESGNVINLPLKQNQLNHFDFYQLESEANLEALLKEVAQSQYILIPSRRVFANHPLNRYPRTACYYQLLFSGDLGFVMTKKFTSFPNLSLGQWHWEIDDERAEETWSVFDHPVIRLFEKEKALSEREYRQLFNSCLGNLAS